MKKLPILMTASISTRGMKGACFTDKEREMMYANALSFYIMNLLGKKEQRIVFAENSGWDLHSLITKLPSFDHQQIEFISIPVEMFDISKGKGYNELLLINETLKRSSFIKESGAFFKVTGRYPIYNLGYFLECAGKRIYRDKMSLYADIKDHRLYDLLGLGWCGHAFECRLFGVENSYYLNNIAPLYVKCNDYTGDLIENILFNYVKRGGKISLRFKREPHFGGIEGSDISTWTGTKEQDSLKGKFKRLVGNFFRKCMPWFWF